MNKALLSSKTPEWETPLSFFDTLNKEFHFTLDPASTHENAKCAKHYTKEEDGLSKDWSGEVVFCNPPYGRELPKWIKKCYESAGGGQRLLCSFRREQIQEHFMTTLSGRPKFVSYGED